MDEHRCGHPGGKVHQCGCDEPKSHRASKIGCQEFSDRPMAFVDPVDPQEESSAFVNVRPEPSIWVKEHGKWKEYGPK